MSDVIHLLKRLNLRKYISLFEENRIDGPTLMNCLSVQDVIELGITIGAKAITLLEEITKLKETNEVETISELSVDS